MNSNDLVCGVDKDLVERFLLLVRDNYRKAEKAIFFLEETGHVTYSAPIANLRDILSHLASMLDPATPVEKKEAQLQNAEEHLRRAILEPYLIVIGRELKAFKKLYARYERELLPERLQHPELKNAPDAANIRAQLGRIADLAEAGRATKAKNLWDPIWETGVSGLIEANAMLQKLHAEVREHWYQHQSILDTDLTRRELAELKALFKEKSAYLTSQRPASLESELMRVIGLVDLLRKGFQDPPSDEKEVQQIFQMLLFGAGVAHDREAISIPYSAKHYFPDFVLEHLDLAIEIKLCPHRNRVPQLVGEINDDILAYKTKFSNLLFVVYDLGHIREMDRFAGHFELHPNVSVRVVKQ